MWVWVNMGWAHGDLAFRRGQPCKVHRVVTTDARAVQGSFAGQQSSQTPLQRIGSSTPWWHETCPNPRAQEFQH